jgi:hypothetical protein
MKPIILACLLTMAAAPLVAAHAEGNGPAFPGLQTPDVAITTTAGLGQSRDVTTLEHSSVASEGRVNEALPVKGGLTPAQQAQRQHTWAVLNSNNVD